ncbi:GNAT family N-acetyltransferase [Chromobacterium alticapitis]|nr:GNAT family N-acetyltransferase [Chromobacterium alticapitis]
MLSLPLISERLLLRDFHEEDLPVYQALRASPAFGRHYQPDEVSPFFSALLLRRFIEQQAEPRRAWQLAIALRANGELIGSVGLRSGAAPGAASFGLELAEAAWGQGLALEAGRLLLDAGFNQLGLHRIEADTAEGNLAARRLAARLGFAEGPAREGRSTLALSLAMLGAQSDWRLEGGVLSRLDGCWRVLTPGLPDYYCGNALLLDQAPAAQARAGWERCFDAAFADAAGIRHRTLLWPLAENGGAARYGEWTAAGYRYEESVVLLLNEAELRPVPASAWLAIRPLAGEGDWRQWRQLMADTRAPGHEEADYRAYLQGRERRFLALEAAGQGHVWGVFDGHALLCGAGLFLLPGMARFQHVATAPHVRRLGLASQLLSHLAQWGLQRTSRLVIVADAHYHALDLYRKLGFVEAGREASLCWWPKD